MNEKNLADKCKKCQVFLIQQQIKEIELQLKEISKLISKRDVELVATEN